MLPIQYIWIPLLIAALDWITVGLRLSWLGYLTKPGVMLALLVWLWIASGFCGPMLLVGLALIFSLFGDIFLMLSAKRFIPAIIAFSLAHLAYIIVFNNILPPINLPSIIIVVFTAITAFQIAHRTTIGLRANQRKKMVPFIWVYSTLIAVMLLSALMTLVRPEWENIPALWVSAGALLFFLSDSLLAFDNFVSPIAYGQLKVRVSYHLGQIAIVIGLAYQFLS